MLVEFKKRSTVVLKDHSLAGTLLPTNNMIEEHDAKRYIKEIKLLRKKVSNVLEFTKEIQEASSVAITVKPVISIS